MSREALDPGTLHLSPRRVQMSIAFSLSLFPAFE